MAHAIDVRHEPNRARGSIPPNRPASARIGKVHAIKPSTGASRTPSLPRTISALDRSVASMWSSVPRALSRQTAPAVAAGAGQQHQGQLDRRDRVVQALSILRQFLDRDRLARVGKAMHVVPDDHHTDENRPHEPRSQRIELPPARSRQPLVNEDRPRSQAHAEVLPRNSVSSQ